MDYRYNVDNDMYHPIHNTQYEADSYYSQSIAGNSLTKKQKKELDDIKAADSGWRKMSIKDAGSRLKRDIEYYSTGYVPNTRIRCPVTGVHTNYRVGSRDENLFYCVCNSMGYNGQKTPDHLYYSSPDEYENHWRTVVSPEEKQRWFAKNLIEKVNRSSKL